MRDFKGFRHGINLGGWLSQADGTTEEYFNTFITEADIRSIALMGMDHVRLPVDYNWIEDEDGRPIEAGLAHIDDCAAWCKAAGLHLLIDLHKAFGYTFDPLAKDADREIFFHDAALQDRFIALWRRLAQRYGRQGFIAFELLNEVVSPNVVREWNAIAARTVDAIREFAPEAWIVIGGVGYNHVRSVPLLDPPRDARIVYNFHCYEPMLFTHQKAYWMDNMPADLSVEYPGELQAYIEKSAEIDLDLAGALAGSDVDAFGPAFFEALFAPALAYAEANDAPLYCGEYGVIDQAPVDSALRWLEDINAAFERHAIGRALWTYKRKDFGLIDPHYDGVRDRIVQIL